MAVQVTGLLIEKLLNVAPMQLVVALRKRVLRVNPKAKLRWHGIFSKREGRVLHLFLSQVLAMPDGRLQEVFIDVTGMHATLEQCMRTSALGERFTTVAAGTYAAFSNRVRQLGVRLPVPEGMARITAEIDVVLDEFEDAYEQFHASRAAGQAALVKWAPSVLLPIERAATSLAQAIRERNVGRVQHLAVFAIDAFHFQPLGEGGESLFALAARSGSPQIVRELSLAIPLESLRTPHFAGAVAAAYARGDAATFVAVCRHLGERSFVAAQSTLLLMLVGGDKEALRVMIDALRFQTGWGGALALKALRHAIADALLFAAAPHSLRVQRLCATMSKQLDAMAQESLGSLSLQQLRVRLALAASDRGERVAMGERALDAGAWAFRLLECVPNRLQILGHLLQVFRLVGLDLVRSFMHAAGLSAPAASALWRQAKSAGNEVAARLLVQSFGACAGGLKPAASSPVAARAVSVDFTNSDIAVI